jgi:hypothetical protein
MFCSASYLPAVRYGITACSCVLRRSEVWLCVSFRLFSLASPSSSPFWAAGASLRGRPAAKGARLIASESAIRAPAAGLPQRLQARPGNITYGRPRRHVAGGRCCTQPLWQAPPSLGRAAGEPRTSSADSRGEGEAAR